MAIPGGNVPLGGSTQRGLPLDMNRRVRQFRDDHGLSRREEDVLLLVASGVHPKGIADALGCGYATVRTYLRRIYRKLGCSGARELVVRFFNESIVDDATSSELAPGNSETHRTEEIIKVSSA